MDEGSSDKGKLNSAETHGHRLFADFAAGTIIDKRYEVRELLGAGGMGAVYRVRDLTEGKEYALKTFRSLVFSEKQMRQFLNEAAAQKNLDHRGIVKLHRVGISAEGLPYFLMDLCDGRTLASVLEHRLLPIQEAVELFSELAMTLGYAHTQGIVHRDIKPSNIMLVTQGRKQILQILDFGVAKVLGESGVDSASTGEFCGSPVYASPEQTKGKAADYRSDIYSFGCVVFHALTGHPPYTGETPLALMLQHQEAPVPKITESNCGRRFDPELEFVVSKMMAKRPEDRYDTILRVAYDLKTIAQGGSITDAVRAIKSVEKKSNKPIIAAAIGLCLLIVGFAIYVFKPGPQPIKEDEKQDGLQETFFPMLEPKHVNVIDKGAKFSESASGQARVFHFPQKAVAMIHYGDPEGPGAPAVGTMKLRIPFRVEILEPSEFAQLPHFRDDEIDGVIFRDTWADADQLLDIVSRFKKIWLLNLAGTNIDDEQKCLESMNSFPELRELNFFDCNIPDASSLLKLNCVKNHALVSLNVGHAGQVRRLLPELAKCAELWSFRAGRTMLTDDDLIAISHMKALKVLEIRDNIGITDAGVERLKILPKLEWLEISGTSITPECSKFLVQFPALKCVYVTSELHSPWKPSELKRVSAVLAEKGININRE